MAVKNYQELAVQELIQKMAPQYPQLAKPEQQEDVACIALNQLKPRYARRPAELARFMSQEESDANDAAVRAAVLSAIEFVVLSDAEAEMGIGHENADPANSSL